jgi:hypothetical protein
MAGLPREYARMGFKKGWAIYNRSKIKKNKKVVTLARRKRSGFRKSRSKSSSGFGMGNVIKVLSGAAIAALYEVFVSPLIPLDAMIKNIIELVMGLFVATMKGVPMPIRAFGAALATVNAYSLIVPYVQGMSGGTSSSAGW